MGIYDKYLEFKHQRDVKRVQKLMQQKYNSMLTKLGLEQTATQEEINEAIINWAKTITPDNMGQIYEITITDEQQHDTDFMSRLYDANLGFAFRYKPHKDLHQNHQFIVDCIRRIYDSRVDKQYNPTFFSHALATVFLYSNTKEFRNPEFINALLREFPDQDIISVAEAYNTGATFSEIENTYQKVLQEVDGKLLANQARRFGRSAVRRIPTQHKEYLDILSSGVEKDAFDSLSLMPVEYLQNNKDLIRRAFEVYSELKTLDPKAQLTSPAKFFTINNHPTQSKGYMCHGDYHSYTYFSKPHLEFTYKFANDKTFWESINYDQDSKQAIIDSMKDTCKQFVLDPQITQLQEDIATM